MPWTGSQWVTSPGACQFCRMLAGREDVRYAVDEAHDHCKCTVTPAGEYEVGDIPATLTDAAQIIDDRELARWSWLDVSNPFRSNPPPRYDPLVR